MKDQSKLPRTYTGYAISTVAFLTDTWEVCPAGAAKVVQQAKTNRFGTLEVVGQRFTVTLLGGLFTVKVEKLGR